MRIFRIKIYLYFFTFIYVFFEKKIKESALSFYFRQRINKRFYFYTSQLRSSFLILLLYLKEKYKNKNEILICSYNLKEMVNIAYQLRYKIIFYDIGVNGTPSIDEIKKKINAKTSCVLLTNIYNDFNFSNKLKKICKERKVTLIEDSAISFDSFSIKNKKKIYSGSFGDYSLFSFNIMKNISALYGGAIATNDRNFINYANNLLNKKNYSFSKLLYIRQILIYLLLKLFSINFLYKYFFYYLFYFSNKYKIKFIETLIYPSLRFKMIQIPYYYFSRIVPFSKKLIYFQLKNIKQRDENHKIRKQNNIYYFKKIKQLNLGNIKAINISDFNFQNFLDFPVLFNDKNSIHNYLLIKGFETKKINYFNCSKFFKSKIKNNFKNSEMFENELLCFPNNNKINHRYIDKLFNEIKEFYKKN